MQSLDLEFTVTTTPQAFELDPKSSGLVNKFVVYDSIIPDTIDGIDVSFYPAAEFVFPDESAFFTEGIGMYDEMEMAFRFGNENIGYFENTFAWNGLQLVDTKLTNQISGQALFVLKSILEKKDYPQKKLYSGDFSNVIDSIARELGVNSYTTQSNPIKVSSTIYGNGVWTRAGQTAKDFLLNHSSYIYSTDNSPVFTFVNMLGEFYYMTANDLASQTPINQNNPYTLMTDDNSASDFFQDPQIIQSYVLGVMGSEVNRKNYNKSVSSYSKTNNTSSNTSETIRTYLPRGQGKSSIPTSAISNPTDMSYYGYDTNESNRLYRGWKNNLFKSSAFTNKMIVKVKYSPLLASGRNIQIEIPSARENTTISTEYSGNYTILNCKLVHEKDLTPVNILTVGKSRINYSRDNTFASSFVS